MTSGNFQSYPVADIFVNRETRQRRELTNIEELAESIARVGLIHPIVIQRSGELRVGERRFTAVKRLGWTAISVQFIEDLDEYELQVVEAEENLRRVDMPWKDECDRVKNYHELRSGTEEDWNTVKTAEALGMTSQEASNKLAVASEIIRGNDLVVNADRYSVALGVTRRVTDRRKNAQLAEVFPEEAVEAQRAVPLKCTDFRKWQPKFKGKTKFNFIHCDFPYGIDSDNHAQGGTSAMGSYDDEERIFWELIQCLSDAMDNVIADSAHLMLWYNIAYHTNTVSVLREMGWLINPFPLIWMKSDNTGILPDPSRGPRRIYETALIGSRGDRKIVQPVANAFAAPTTKRIHPHEKNEDMLRHFFRMFVDEYSVVLDPTCGSAGAIRVAENMGANRVLGLEKSKEFYTLAKERFYEECV